MMSASIVDSTITEKLIGVMVMLMGKQWSGMSMNGNFGKSP